MTYLNDQKAFKSMDDAYENIDDYNPRLQTLWLIKISSFCKRIVYQMHRIEYFTCFYFTVLLCCSKRRQIKFYALLNNEDSEQKRVTKYCD